MNHLIGSEFIEESLDQLSVGDAALRELKIRVRASSYRVGPLRNYR